MQIRGANRPWVGCVWGLGEEGGGGLGGSLQQRRPVQSDPIALQALFNKVINNSYDVLWLHIIKSKPFTLYGYLGIRSVCISAPRQL